MNPAFLLPFFGGLLLYFIIKSLIRIPGNLLAKKFKSLGNLTGKSKQEIISKVGSFQGVQNLPDGRSVCTWRDTGYMIAINFNADGIFDGINTEIRS